MSLEQAIQELTAALKENTAALASAAKSTGAKGTRKTGVSQPAPEPAPAAESSAVTEPSTASAPPVAAATAPAQPAAAAQTELTDKDVRTALVELQTRKGSKDEPQKILSKYAANGVIAGVKKEDYAKLIAECKAVK